MDLHTRVEALEQEIQALRRALQQPLNTIAAPFRVVDPDGNLLLSVDTEEQASSDGGAVRLRLFDASGNPQIELAAEPEGGTAIQVGQAIRIDGSGEVRVARGAGSCVLSMSDAGIGVFDIVSDRFGRCTLSVSEAGSILALHTTESEEPGMQLRVSGEGSVISLRNTEPLEAGEVVPSRGISLGITAEGSRMWLSMSPTEADPAILLDADVDTGGNLTIRDADGEEVFGLYEE